jgi:hypothetical protein
VTCIQVSSAEEGNTEPPKTQRGIPSQLRNPAYCPCQRGEMGILLSADLWVAPNPQGMRSDWLLRLIPA